MQNGANKKGFKKGFFLIIGAVVLGLSVLALKQFGWSVADVYSGTAQTIITSDSTKPATNTTVTSAPIVLETNSTTVVSVSPPALPTNPVRKGVAMLGPSGVYLYIVDTDGQTSTLVSKKLKKELVYEGVVSTEDIKKTIGEYITAMYDAGCSKNNIQFIVSSTALNDPKVKTIVEALKGYVVVTQTTKELEGRYAISVAIPPQYRGDSFLLDVTPTICRLSWYEGGVVKTLALPGTKYYQSGKPDSEIITESANLAKQIPPANRKHGYVIWAAIEKSGTNRYAALQNSYSIADKNFVSGLNIINSVKEESKAEMFFDYESAYPMGFLMEIK